jgi:hypothetical protein
MTDKQQPQRQPAESRPGWIGSFDLPAAPQPDTTHTHADGTTHVHRSNVPHEHPKESK